MQEQIYEVSIVLSNPQDTPIMLVIEPWADLYEMEPHSKYNLCFRSPFPPTSTHNIEIEYAPDSLIVYAWAGCLFSLSHNGKILSPGGAFAGPPVPGGVEILKDIEFFTQTRSTNITKDK